MTICWYVFPIMLDVVKNVVAYPNRFGADYFNSVHNASHNVFFEFVNVLN